jgi:hypothetical protein
MKPSPSRPRRQPNKPPNSAEPPSKDLRITAVEGVRETPLALPLERDQSTGAASKQCERWLPLFPARVTSATREHFTDEHDTIGLAQLRQYRLALAPWQHDYEILSVTCSRNSRCNKLLPGATRSRRIACTLTN